MKSARLKGDSRKAAGERSHIVEQLYEVAHGAIAAWHTPHQQPSTHPAKTCRRSMHHLTMLLLALKETARDEGHCLSQP